MRRVAVLLHRWVGLGIAAFLLLTGATGALIAFNQEIECWLQPQLFYAEAPAAGAAMLDPLQVREQLSRRYPQWMFNGIDLHAAPGRTLLVIAERADVPDGEQWFVNPYDGNVQGTRRYGDLRQGTRNLMPFINELHTSLALGEAGMLILGVVALL